MLLFQTGAKSSPLTPSSIQHSGIIFPGKHTGRKCPHASTTTDATSLGTTSLWSNTTVVALKLCHTQCDAPDSVMMPLAQSNSCPVRQRQCVASVTKCQVSQALCGANAVGRMNCGQAGKRGGRQFTGQSGTTRWAVWRSPEQLAAVSGR